MASEATRTASAFTSHDGARAPMDTSDIVDGVTPAVVIEPTTPDAVAATLARASASGMGVVLRGSGSKDGWGRPPRPFDVLLRTTRLNRVLAHDADDLVATVEAGARLSDVNHVLAERGQRLPIDSPHVGATIGGMLATNDAGPLRHRHGTPRDLVLGMSIALPDGTIARSGGRVVKNVAGYDIGRLMTGSHGSLAAILTATFKLSPLPASSRTVVVTLRAPADVVSLIDALRLYQHEPEAIDVRIDTNTDVAGSTAAVLLVRYASVRAAVDDAVTSITALAAAMDLSARVTDGDAAHRLWTDHEATAWRAETVVRLSWKPAGFATAWDDLLRVAGNAPVTLTGRAAIGAGRLSLGGTPEEQERLLLSLRESAHFNHVVIVRSPAALRRRLDVWSIAAPQRSIWQALKSACDPGDTLNAGRGPL